MKKTDKELTSEKSPELSYQLIVIRTVKNPDFEDELDLYKEKRNGPSYGMQGEIVCPNRYNSETSLKVQLTEKEFEAVKKSVLETFK